MNHALAKIFGFLGLMSFMISCSQPPVATTEKPVSLEQTLAATDFAVRSNASMLTMTAVKDSSVPVKGSFNIKSGQLTAAAIAEGTVGNIVVDVTSFDSGLPLRNDRVKEYFFKAVTYPEATLSIKNLPADFFATLKANRKIGPVDISSELTLNGMTKPVSIKINAEITDAGYLEIKTAESVSVSIVEWGFAESLKTLNTICNHASVDDQVKIDVQLSLMPSQK